MDSEWREREGRIAETAKEFVGVFTVRGKALLFILLFTIGVQGGLSALVSHYTPPFVLDKTISCLESRYVDMYVERNEILAPD